MFAPTLLIALLAAGTAGTATQDAPPDDERVRQAFSFLLDGEQEEAVEWFRFEVSVLDTFQLRCLRFILAEAERDPGFWPEADELPYFDPATHAPRQPIPRRRLAPDDSRALRMRAEVNRTRPPRRLRRAWSYDWASGEPRRLAVKDEIERTFENALGGFAPDLDLAEVLVLAELDTGAQRVVLGAFEHAYTDRVGRVFAQSLYEAWASGVEIEMPDVDILGIVHTVLDEWGRWVAPVSARKHKALYATLGDLFASARRYRGLREALAALYLNADPVLWDGYGESRARLHALWDRDTSLPAPMSERLPTDPDAWTDFLASWAETCQEEPDLRAAGLAREATLTSDAARVRATLVWVLEQMGAFERDARPSPPPAAPPVDDDGS